jgi:hypothetical protein
MIDGVPYPSLTFPTLLGLAILFILLGKLVPYRYLKDKEVECEKWRKAYETERESRRVSDAQTAELLELARTTHAIVVAAFDEVPSIAKHRLPSGGHDVAPMAR